MSYRPTGPTFRAQLGARRQVPLPASTDYVARFGAVGYWPLNETSAGAGPVTRVDVIGGNDLTDTNTVTNSTGLLYATCAQFTAANNEHLLRADNAALSVGDIDFLVAIRAKFDSLGVVRGLIGRRSGTTARDYALFYDTNSPNANRLKFRIYDAGGTEIASAAYNVAVSTGVWYSILGYHDAVNNEIGISVNGSAWTTTATGGLAPADVTANFLIGILQSGTTNPHNGQAEAALLCKSPPLGIAAVKDEIRDRYYNAGAGRDYPWVA